MTADPFLRSRGLKIPKDGTIVRGRIRGALKSGGYEGKEAEAVLKVVTGGDRVLELGAGIGYMSTLIASKRPVDRVVSYEANPALIPFIHAMHAANDVTNVTVHNALLSDGPGDPVPFYVRQSFLSSSMDRESDPDGIVATEMVARHDIHAVLAELRPQVLVCDIEGAEARLLPAADLSCLRAAVIELHPQWIGQAGVQAVFDAFHRGGLTYFPRWSDAKVVCFRKGW
ncbi:FkbM family methyltransferase [Roseivivax isoporae]|uniref:FkbM family methyltransferase n=1 Tax=Roseivivax isoporae LMG 25204 TaxID=1449351 RepID=X7F6D5_9RHOB|nr:FkbM family methyltransferase [Roseivivax isoporae]ETX28308.1 FkbM family methyltransferase [Roseivivax isoporae LMG 25204]